jgi:AraC-like DNA-binding protein
MPEQPLMLKELHSIGADTREWMVGKESCPDLAAHHIRLVGVSAARHGFAFVRERPRIGQLLVCCAGQGEVLVDGRYQPCRPGQAYLTPAGALHAYRALPGHEWLVCWVMFDAGHGDPPVVAVPGPLLARVDQRPLHDAIQGLYREHEGANDQALVLHWVALIQLLARRALAPFASDGRLWRLWERVDADLARPWSLGALAGHARMSGEHLRRLSLKQLGRTPMDQVAFLRMRRAAALLAAGGASVAEVAASVGYRNAFAFSTAFKRVLGRPPSALR